MNKRQNVIAAMILGIAISTLVKPALAAGATDLAHLHAGQPSRTPIGWQQFCGDNPNDCRAPRSTATVMRLDDRSWSELLSVNLTFNKAIEPVTDQDFRRHRELGLRQDGQGRLRGLRPRKAP